jgi:PAS domain S-box-containing protein
MGSVKRALRNLLVGTTPIASRMEFKYALLCGQFALIFFSIGLIYCVVDCVNNVYIFLPGYGVMMAVSGMVILLNRTRRYVSASIVLLSAINAIVFLFCTNDHPYGGVFFFFMSCSIAGLILAGHYNRIAGGFFALLPIVLGIVAYLGDFNFIPPPSYEPGVMQFNFTINYTLGILSNIFIVSFLISRNKESERSLRDSEKRLLRIAADLTASEDRFALAVKGTRAGIYEWNLKQNSIYVSAIWKQLLGYAEHELNTLTMEDFGPLVHPDDTARTNDIIQRHMQRLEPYRNEIRMRKKSGEYRWFLDSGSFKADETGTVLLVVGSIIDIEDRKKSDEEILFKNSQLAKTNEELDRFVYSASHDMRAPLSSLLGLINISEKSEDVAELHMLLNMMKSRIKTMEGFIKEVTDYSRNVRLDIALQETDLDTIIKEVTHNLAYMSTGKNVRIDINLPEKISCLTDPNRLKVILSNLTSNAYKYHRFDQADPYIRFSAVKNQHEVSITVEDNGMGIAEDYHVKIFDMFFRASVQSEGSGLGLYIVQETLAKLNGTIRVTSTPGSGSAFTVTLPA